MDSPSNPRMTTHWIYYRTSCYKDLVNCAFLPTNLHECDMSVYSCTAQNPSTNHAQCISFLHNSSLVNDLISTTPTLYYHFPTCGAPVSYIYKFKNGGVYSLIKENEHIRQQYEVYVLFRIYFIETINK